MPGCPCGALHSYEACCGRWHAGEPAPDAERLMRSRYSAHVLRLKNYLLATWHPNARPAQLDLDAAPLPKWIGLQVLRHQASGADSAIVEFVARYRVGGRAHRLHESSRFVRKEGCWYYLDGLGGPLDRHE